MKIFNLIATINHSINNAFKEYIMLASKQNGLEEGAFVHFFSFKSTCKVEVSH
jgi:hypothetical protein